MRMDESCSDPVHTHTSSPASGFPLLPGVRVLPLLSLLLVLVSACVSTPAVVAKGSNNRGEETKSLQGIPDATIPMGKIFHYPVPVFALQGTVTQYKVTSASGTDLPKWLEFDSSTNTLQGLPMAGEGGMYLLNIAASGGIHGQKTGRAAGNFTIHVQDSSLSSEESLNHMPNSYQCGKEVPITSAELILSAGAETLEAQDRLHIVSTMAEYLHLDSSLLTLLQHPGAAPRGSQSLLTVLAEDTGHMDSTGNHYVGLSWPVRCGRFAMLHQFIQVLQHNVDSHHLSQLLGYEITGWRILRRGDYGRKSPRQQRGPLMITPTPTVKPTRITQGPAPGQASRPLAFTVPSCLLTKFVASPTQSLSPFCRESVTTASYKMQNKIHLVSQESLEMDSAWDMSTSSPISMKLADFLFPDLSPSLITETRLLFTELEVLPARAPGMSLLLEQLETHVPETDLNFLPSKSEVSIYHLPQDITSGTDQISRPMDMWVTNTLHEWPHSSEAFPPKTHFHGFLPGATSVSEVPGHSDKAKSHFPKLESLSLEILPSLFQKASVRTIALSDFTFPIHDMFPPVSARSSLSPMFTNGCEELSHPFTYISQPSGFPFAGGKSIVSSLVQREERTLYPKLIFSPEASASFPSTFTSTVPGEVGASYEPSLVILSHPDTTSVLPVPADFATSDLSEFPRPTKTLPAPDSSSILRADTQSASVSSSGTKEMHPDKDLGTRGILPHVTEPTLESHRTLDIKPDAVELPLVSLFNATSHLPSSTPEVVQTLLPSHQDPSTWLFPTSERLQFMESAWSLPPSSVPQELQTLTQGQANTSPRVIHSIKPLTATIGCLFFFPVPAHTFYDEEDGNSTRLSLRVAPADGSPSGSESWLQFDTSQQAMHGYPLHVDFQYSPQEFVLSATDSGGLTAWESFTIELLKPSSVPCHLYTVRTKNSYHSFLRDRKMVSLFLEKLSLYLNSSSPWDIVVAALQPGSTVISWYDSSLCARANGSSSWCARGKTQGALQKLRVPGGYISPHFAQAMLPEYKMDLVFSVSYSDVCAADTVTPLGSLGSAEPTLPARNDSVDRKVPPALLSSLCATAGVLLGILGYWLCRCHGRIPGSWSVLCQGSSQLSCAGVELDGLRPRKAPEHECRASPPPLIPPVAPLTSQDQPLRLIPLPHIIPPFQPPKYQLPPCYGAGRNAHHDQGDSQRLKNL